MIDAKNLFLFLKKNKIDFFTGVPDSVLKNFISLTNEKTKEISSCFIVVFDQKAPKLRLDP